MPSACSPRFDEKDGLRPERVVARCTARSRPSIRTCGSKRVDLAQSPCV